MYLSANIDLLTARKEEEMKGQVRNVTKNSAVIREVKRIIRNAAKLSEAYRKIKHG